MTVEAMTVDKALEILKASDDHRVLVRLKDSMLALKANIPADAALGVVLDTETTGKNADDKIIELGMVQFAYNRNTGEVYGVLDSLSELEDPGMPIPPEATAVNHITDDMVRGKKIDDDKVQSFVERCELVIAHNASFDRPMCERRFPVFKNKAWGCSLREVDWDTTSVGGGKLEYIAYKLGFFYEGHRAEVDCLALLYALSLPLPEWDDQNALARLLANVHGVTKQIFATGAPFDSKEALKSRGYRWSDGSGEYNLKAWHTQVDEAAFDQELAWLKESAYLGRSFTVAVADLDAYSRHSGRLPDVKRAYG